MNDRRITSTDGDTAVTFLRQVAELIAIDNLPAPITVAVHNRSVLVSAEDLPTWCKALGVDVPPFKPSQHDNVSGLFADVDVLGFHLESNRPAEKKPAVA